MEWSWRIDTKSHLTPYKYRWSQTEIFVAMCVHRYIGWCANIYFFALSDLERLKEIAASSSERSGAQILVSDTVSQQKDQRALERCLLQVESRGRKYVTAVPAAESEDVPSGQTNAAFPSHKCTYAKMHPQKGISFLFYFILFFIVVDFVIH